MSNFNNYRVSPEAEKDGEALGITGSVAGKIAFMVEQSARFTHPLGNRRFDQFVFRVDADGTVRSVAKLPDGFREETARERQARLRRERKARRNSQ